MTNRTPRVGLWTAVLVAVLSVLFYAARAFVALCTNPSPSSSILHQSAFHGNKEMIEVLLDEKVYQNAKLCENLRAKDVCCRTPRDLAVKEGHTEVAELLLHAEIRRCKDR